MLFSRDSILAGYANANRPGLLSHFLVILTNALLALGEAWSILSASIPTSAVRSDLQFLVLRSSATTISLPLWGGRDEVAAIPPLCAHTRSRLTFCLLRARGFRCLHPDPSCSVFPATGTVSVQSVHKSNRRAWEF